MKDILKLGLTLMIYAAVAGLLLGFIYTKTKPKIDEQAKMEKEQAIKEVMPAGAAVIVEDTLSDGMIISVGYSDETKTKPVGYAAMAYGVGFSSTIKTMVGLTTDFKVNAIKVISQSETPGLGTHTQDEWFKLQFANKTVDELLVDKDGGTIKAITGATISTRAVTNSIKELILKLKSIENELPHYDAQAVADSSI
ncbi:RnfABCDGE type electron transport complex subunit G [bacterium]|nr:RnfABCDGE type electron transport complex subunit G [bacterium]RKZ27626.1 MAG: hypothetical protein DRQ26_02790 [bacterium]